MTQCESCAYNGDRGSKCGAANDEPCSLCKMCGNTFDELSCKCVQSVHKKLAMAGTCPDYEPEEAVTK